MIDVVLSGEQIRSAPREVKEWIRSILLAELTPAPEPEHARGEMGEATLAECTVTEAGRVLEQIRDDYLACQVFFELSRDNLLDQNEPPGLHRIPIAEILRHTRLGDLEHLGAYLDRIGEAFQAVRHDPSIVLFALDRLGGLYIHDTTRRSIKRLWQALASRPMNTSDFPGIATPAGPTVPLDIDPAA